MDYRIKMSAASGATADNDNYFGAADQGAAEYDAQDAAEPPRTPDGRYTALYFPREQWTRYAGRYAADVRATAREQGQYESWDFVVETTEAGQPVTITWDAAALPATRFSFTLLDLETGARIDMAAQNSYTYTASGGAAPQSRFRIEVVKLAADIVTRTHTLGPGWHLISIPVEPEITNAFEQLGDDLPLLDVYQFVEGAFYSGSEADVQAGLGYWLHISTGAQIDITGLAVPRTDKVRVPLVPGWNMIGNPFDDALAWGDNIALECAGVSMPLSQARDLGTVGADMYAYDGDAYHALDPGASLEPWRGYLVKAGSVWDLILAH